MNESILKNSLYKILIEFILQDLNSARICRLNDMNIIGDDEIIRKSLFLIELNDVFDVWYVGYCDEEVIKIFNILGIDGKTEQEIFLKMLFDMWKDGGCSEPFQYMNDALRAFFY